MAHKEFTQEQIREILAKASEIQRSDKKLDTEQYNITSEELREIAADVGISAEVLGKAIKMVESRSNERFNWIIGTGKLQSSTTIDKEITGLQLDRLFPELNAFTGQKGNVEQIGESYDWEQIENGLESIRRITVVPNDEKTKIIQYVNWDELRGMGLFLSAFFGALALALILKVAGFPKSTYLLLSSIGALAGYFGFMSGLKYYFNNQKKKFESIMQLITDVLERPAQHRLSIDDAPQKSEEKQAQKSKTRS
jgi:hypothetical protein